MPVSEADAREVMRRYFHGVNNEDWVDMRGIWHDDAVVDVSGGLHFEGADAILDYFPGVLKNFPKHYDDPYAIYVAGDVVTVEIHFTGETVEGVHAEWEAVDVFKLVDGRIKNLTTWYDMGFVVNLLRTPGPAAKRLAALAGVAASKSAFYTRRFRELGVDAAQVAGDLTVLPPTREADLAAAPGDFLAAAARDVRQVLGAGSYALQLTRGDLEDAAGCLAAALTVAGVTRDDRLAGDVPALADAALKLRVPYAVGAPATVSVDAAGVHRDGALLPLLGTPGTGTYAAACGRGDGLHLLDAHLVEVVDDEGLPAAAGDVLVTPLGRRGTPLLRFATGLRATRLEGDCPCGSALPRIAPEP